MNEDEKSIHKEIMEENIENSPLYFQEEAVENDEESSEDIGMAKEENAIHIDENTLMNIENHLNHKKKVNLGDEIFKDLLISEVKRNNIEDMVSNFDQNKEPIAIQSQIDEDVELNDSNENSINCQFQDFGRGTINNNNIFGDLMNNDNEDVTSNNEEHTKLKEEIAEVKELRMLDNGKSRKIDDEKRRKLLEEREKKHFELSQLRDKIKARLNFPSQEKSKLEMEEKENSPKIVFKKFEYKPLNAEKEKRFETLFTLKSENQAIQPQKKIVKVQERDDDVQNLVINTLINDYTKPFSNSTNKSDVIQCALEYNYYLIRELIDNKNSVTKAEYEHSLIILWENLKKLAKNVDYHLKFYNLRKDSKYNKAYSEYKKATGDRDQKYSSRKRRRDQEITIIISKSVLENNN